MASSQTANSFQQFDSIISVQELVKKPLISIPKIFALSNKNNPNLLKYRAANSSTQLPVIDLELLQTADLELEKLHSSFKEWGFFQLVNHGVSSSLLEKLKHEIEEFYKLPLEEKMKLYPRPGEFEGYGGVARSEGKFDWSDRIYMTTNPIHLRNPYLLPKLPSSLRITLESYLVEMQKLSMKLIGLIAKALNTDVKEMEEVMDDGLQSVRMTYYPPCPQPDLVAGMTPHSDATVITIVNQLNGVDGFQIKKDGAWIPVSFLPGAFVVNAGDMLEMMSNGVYRSSEHCVAVNPEKERLSVAFFVDPKLEAEIGPMASMVGPLNPPMFRRVVTKKYVESFFSRALNGKSYLDSMKIGSGKGD